LTGFSNELDYWNSTAMFCTLDVFPLWCADSLEKAGSDPHGYCWRADTIKPHPKIVVKPLGVCSHCKHAQYPKTSSHANVKLRLNKCSAHTSNSL